MQTKVSNKREKIGTLYFEDGCSVDKFINGVLEDVKQANSTGIYFNITIEHEWDYENVREYSIYGDRPLTDKERAAAVVLRQKDRANKVKLKEKLRDVELKELKRLSAKYPRVD